MTPDDIDQILSSDDLLEPASGFVMSVMEAVHQQASEPPSRAFPWFRFAMGLIGCLVAAATGTILLLRVGPALGALSAPLAFLTSLEPELGCVTAALLLSFALVSLRKLRSTV
jgi:hypothetical protein